MLLREFSVLKVENCYNLHQSLLVIPMAFLCQIRQKEKLFDHLFSEKNTLKSFLVLNRMEENQNDEDAY